MPLGDGTGPRGLGPGTGRGRGGCRGFSYSPVGFGPRGMGIFGAIIPIAAAIVRDLSNYNGLLRSFSRKLLPKKQMALGRQVNASYTVIDEEKSKGGD
ncbi:MAG: DUF5320 family protein [Chitinispirillaceae bacterium]|nr:DUF5320 family protein [Chitinispirillaceae bacterium]